MKRTIGFLSLAIFGLSLVASSASAATWSNGHTIKSVEPHVGGWVWVRLERANDAKSAEGCNSSDLQLGSGDDSSQRVFKTILAAFLAGKTVDFEVVKEGDGSNCNISRVRMH